MKKTVTIIIIILLIIIIPIFVKISEYRTKQNEIRKFNLEYEKYKGKTIYGAEVGSIMNNAINNNITYKIEKDEKGRYIDDDMYCVIVEINIPTKDEKGNEKEELYRMETIDSLGMEKFVKNFSTFNFEYQEIKYNKLKRVNYIKIKMSNN